MRLTELETFYGNEPASDILDVIEEKCQHWLQLSNKKIMYRGVKPHISKDRDVFEIKTRTTRPPVDSPAIVHQLFNAYIDSVGGVANRDNSVFVTSDWGVAGAYGQVYAVFPTGKINYTWHPEFADWSTDFRYELDGGPIFDFSPGSVLSQLIEYYNERTGRNQQTVTAYDRSQALNIVMFDRSMRGNTPTKDWFNAQEVKAGGIITDAGEAGLAQAFDVPNEVMIKCDSAIYVLPQVASEAMSLLI